MATRAPTIMSPYAQGATTPEVIPDPVETSRVFSPWPQASKAIEPDGPVVEMQERDGIWQRDTEPKTGLQALIVTSASGIVSIRKL